MNKLSPIVALRVRYPETPEQCFACKCWDTQYPNACSRFYSEKIAWAMPGGCPVARREKK